MKRGEIALEQIVIIIVVVTLFIIVLAILNQQLT